MSKGISFGNQNKKHDDGRTTGRVDCLKYPARSTLLAAYDRYSYSWRLIFVITIISSNMLLVSSSRKGTLHFCVMKHSDVLLLEYQCVKGVKTVLYSYDLNVAFDTSAMGIKWPSKDTCME